MKSVYIFLGILCFAISSSGQKGTIGFTNIDAIVFSMPEMEQINKDLDIYRTALSDQVTIKTQQFNLFVDAFQKLKDNPSTPDSMIQAKQVEFINKQNDVKTYQNEAEKLFTGKQAELINPLYDQVQQAIEEVRKEKGFGLIINSHVASNNSIILAYDAESDITEAVFLKLGVPMPKPSEEASNDGN